MLATVRAVPGQNRFLEFLDGTLTRPPVWVAEIGSRTAGTQTGIQI